MIAWGWLIVAWLLGCLSVAIPVLVFYFEAVNIVVDHSGDSDNVTKESEEEG